jgi:hypothetical protein
MAAPAATKAFVRRPGMRCRHWRSAPTKARDQIVRTYLNRAMRNTYAVRKEERRQYFPWKIAWSISGQNSFKMLNAPSKPICVSHFWPVLVQVRSLPG